MGPLRRIGLLGDIHAEDASLAVSLRVLADEGVDAVGICLTRRARWALRCGTTSSIRAGRWYKLGVVASIPESSRWLFWDVDVATLDPERHANYILPRVLEFGGIDEVRWAVAVYGMDGIHRFLRDVGHPELSERTLRFWRAALKAHDEAWASPPAWRKSSGAPWVA